MQKRAGPVQPVRPSPSSPQARHLIAAETSLSAEALDARGMCPELPEAMADGSFASLELKLIEIGVRIIRHARVIIFQLGEVVVTGPMVGPSSPRSADCERNPHARDHDPPQTERKRLARFVLCIEKPDVTAG